VVVSEIDELGRDRIAAGLTLLRDLRQFVVGVVRVVIEEVERAADRGREAQDRKPSCYPNTEPMMHGVFLS
jgi:hypothetical protein